MANETQAETGQTAPGEANMKPGDEAPPGTPGTGENLCRDCGGSGELDGRSCPTCDGTGKIVEGISGG